MPHPLIKVEIKVETVLPVASISPKSLKTLERVKGIEPSSSAWKAIALPLSYTRILVACLIHALATR